MSHYACRICNSEHREAIEQLLLQKIQYRKIAQEYADAFDCDLHLLEQSVAAHKEHSPKKLTLEENEFLEKLKKGEASLDEASRFVAVRTFENMLKNPAHFKFIDFFRTELLKLKRDEIGIKETWAKELIGRMFAGKLPPIICCGCGHKIFDCLEHNETTLLNQHIK